MAVTTWVVVADGSRARFFETPGLKLHLREIEDLVDIVPSGPALSEKDRMERLGEISARFAAGLVSGFSKEVAPQLGPATSAAMRGMMDGSMSVAMSDQHQRQMARLEARATEFACYVVEVCPGCSWNHLARTFLNGIHVNAEFNRAARRANRTHRHGRLDRQPADL